MVVGSFASTYWGRPRLTHDADLVVEIHPEQVGELARLLAPEFYAPEFVIEEAVRKREQFNTISLEYAFKVDLWPRKATAYHEQAFERRLLGLMFDREVWVSSPEDVILSKLLWYRAAPSQDRQVQDALGVFEIQQPYLEHDYLDRWAADLGIVDLLDRIKQEAATPPEV